MRWRKGSRIKLISESEAPVGTRVIFDEIRQALGIPTVPLLYQVYAAFPGFLELHWSQFKPVIESRQFFQIGARLAAECYTRAHNYFELRSLVFDLDTPPNGFNLAHVLDYYQYLDPLLLMIIVAQMQALEAPIGDAERRPEPAVHPVFSSFPDLPPDITARAVAQHVWEERRRLLNVAFISEEHRAFALWPDFYREYWTALRPIVNSPLYADCQYRMGESAWNMAGDLPGSIETSLPQLLQAKLTHDQISSLVRIQESLMGAMTGLLLDVTFARIGWEAAIRSRLIAPETTPGASTSSSPTRAA